MPARRGRAEFTPGDLIDLRFGFAGRDQIVLRDGIPIWGDLLLHNYVPPQPMARPVPEWKHKYRRMLRCREEVRAELRAYGLTDAKIDSDHEPLLRLEAAKMREPQHRLTAAQVLDVIAAEKTAKLERSQRKTASAPPVRQRRGPKGRKTDSAAKDMFSRMHDGGDYTPEKLIGEKQDNLAREYEMVRSTWREALRRAVKMLPPAGQAKYIEVMPNNARQSAGLAAE